MMAQGRITQRPGHNAPWSVVQFVDFNARFYWVFECVRCNAATVVAEALLTATKRAPARAFLANFLTRSPSGEWSFANETPRMVKARMTAPRAKRPAGILDRLLEFAAAPRVAAVMAQPNAIALRRCGC